MLPDGRCERVVWDPQGLATPEHLWRGSGELALLEASPGFCWPWFGLRFLPELSLVARLALSFSGRSDLKASDPLVCLFGEVNSLDSWFPESSRNM